MERRYREFEGMQVPITYRLAIGLLIACAGLLLPLAPGIAQSPISASVGASAELLQNRTKEVQASSELDEATSVVLLELYQKAISFVEEERSHKAASEEYARARESAPIEARKLRAELVALSSEEVPLLSDELENRPLPELEQQLLSEKSSLAALQAKLSELDGLLELQTPGANRSRQGLTEAKTRLAEVADELKVPPPTGELPVLTQARRWALENETKALSAQIQRLDQELLSQPMRMELLTVQGDMAAFESKRLTARVRALEGTLVERRRAEAESAREEAAWIELKTLGKHSLVQDFAEQNTQLGEELNKLADDLEEVNKEENGATEQAKRVGQNFRLARQKLEIAGLSQALGQMLLEQSRNLPDTTDVRKAERRRDRMLVESSLRQLRNQQERGRLRDITGYVNDLLDEIAETERAGVSAQLLELADARRVLLDKAIAADDTYLQSLGELDFAQRKLFETVKDYDEFLNERLLWIRSGELPSLDTFKAGWETLSVFFTAEHLRELSRALVRPAFPPVVLILGLVGFAILSWKASYFRRRLTDSGRNVGQLRHDRFSNTLQAIAWTLVLASPWPLLFLTVGVHLQTVGDSVALSLQSAVWDSFTSQGQFVPAIGAAFHQLALITFYFAVFRVFCKPAGLAVAHFGWSASDTASLRLEVGRLLCVFLPTVFLFLATFVYDPGSLGGGLGRVNFAIIMAALVFFFARVLAPKSGALSEYYLANPRRPLTLLRYVWLVLGFALPVALATLAMLGYVYTASVFAAGFVDTLWLIVALIFTQQFIVRWLVLTERQLEFRAALDRHQALRATREAQDAGDDAPAMPEEPHIDYRALSGDTGKLINTALTLVAGVALWAIWADVLPAFRVLDEIYLWQSSAMVDGTETIQPITLSDGVLALLIAIIGVVAARRLPALLEIVLLTRLKVDIGKRHAIGSLTQYTIVGTSLIVLFNILGGSWSEIQWLIAALGVGIGFGLQDIVANFISGLILLFERPIRIGDVVTVGETDGVVTKIRSRATTIRNWDQQELIVPNKEFVTGRLLNWTLSDPITRIVIPVGIAYGSDVAQALQLIDEAAREHESVLDEPKPPLVTFESFGDNALTLMLRCFVGSMEYRIQTASELNQAINRKFEDAGIVVAFPQRDIHLDTAQPLDVRIHHVEAKGADAGEQSRLHTVSDAKSKPSGSGSG